MSAPARISRLRSVLRGPDHTGRHVARRAVAIGQCEDNVDASARALDDAAAWHDIVVPGQSPGARAGQGGTRGHADCAGDSVRRVARGWQNYRDDILPPAFAAATRLTPRNNLGGLHSRISAADTLLMSKSSSPTPPFDIAAERMVIVPRDAEGNLLVEELQAELLDRLDSLDRRH